MLSRVLKQQVPTSAGAIVMATGILLLGAMQKVVFQHKELAIISTTLVLLLLFILYIAFVRDMILGVMWERHFCDPISSFGVGTWIAATSVSILVIMNFALFLRPIALILFLLNCILTISYIAIIVRNYILLFKSNGSRLRKKSMESCYWHLLPSNPLLRPANQYLENLLLPYLEHGYGGLDVFYMVWVLF